MASIAPNLVFIWPSSHATIPTGFVRDTRMDSQFPKGADTGVDPNTTGGASAHSHTAPSHSHTMVAHTHTISLYNADRTAAADGGGSDGTRLHNHSGTSDSSSGGTLTDAVTYASTSVLPPHRKVIFIKAQTGAVIQSGMVGFIDTQTVPENYAFCDGANSTPDFRNKYLLGAATGADADVTSTLGSLTHEHAVNHTHTGVTHTHTGTTGGGVGEQATIWTTNHYCPAISHTHQFTLNANSAETGSAYTGNAGSADTVEPAYKKLNPVQAKTNAVLKVGLIAMWLESLASKPKFWDQIDMDGRHLKCSNTLDEVGLTGGSNTHTHTASNSHTHTASGTHSHSATVGIGGGNRGLTSGPSIGNENHTHSVASVSSNTTTWNSITLTSDSSNNEPPYTTVAFLKLTKIQAGGASAML